MAYREIWHSWIYRKDLLIYWRGKENVNRNIESLIKYNRAFRIENGWYLSEIIFTYITWQ